ncbi:MAG: hypothetical protein H6726_20490 [Sandaracinaceae bacterium]|nr:hypothetical protein [Sandaracinaceae bacterium]
MRTSLSKVVLTLTLACMLTACGGGVSAEPLLSGNVMGSYEGSAFTAVNGFATVSNGASVILVGTGNLGCGSEESNSPPSGLNAAIRAPQFAVGTYSNVQVQLYSNVGGFESTGSNQGTLVITSVTDESIAGQITYSYTSADEQTYTLTGTFEVVHCAY